MSQFETIRIADEGKVVSLVLSRPPLNVLNIAMMKEINAALADIARHSQARVLVIKAEGKAFSAGVDVAEHTADKVEQMMNEFHEMFELLSRIRMPIIAAVDGAALGGGCELAIFCDMIVASERAKFGQPEIKVGVFPPIAAVILPWLIGRNRALEFLMSGDNLTAIEAERIGLVNKVFPVDGFEERVNEFVGKITAQSKVILQMTKRAVDGALGRPAMDAIERATGLYMGEMMSTEDAQEGLNAFLEKRQPVWRDR
jgi:cyclohexa-1,5-dienecarbonyl-CoA hydratase